MEKNYEKEAKLVIKKIMLDNDLKFKDLSEILNNSGYTITTPALQQKINRGKFEYTLYLRIVDLLNKNLND